jgi:putative phosphoribosyl transferase
MDNVPFQNRLTAAKELAKSLNKYKGSNAVVLGIPRGGAVTAQVIAQELSLPLGLVVVRKIGHPQNAEYAIAAVSESGTVVENETETNNVDALWLGEETQKQLLEAKRRRAKYWGERTPLNLEGKTVIVVDDGLATGLTMTTAIKEVKRQRPAKVVVAVPVAPIDIIEKLQKEVAECVVLTIPAVFKSSVGAYYQDFPQVEDEEVIRIINES